MPQTLPLRLTSINRNQAPSDATITGMTQGAQVLGASTSISARPRTALMPALVAVAVIAAVAVLLNAWVSWRQAALFGVGAGAGVVLYHAAFGFTSSWRVFIANGRGAGLRAQMLMLAVTCAVFFPVLASGNFFGQAVRGSVAPAGLSVVFGAFLFGIGMQLGGGCASGTLYTAGGGNTRMIVVLLAFIAGSVLGTAHAPWFSSLPAPRSISLVSSLGPMPGFAVSLALFGAIVIFTRRVERRRHAAIEPLTAPSSSPQSRWLHGPWPLVAGALGLAAVNIATLALAGRPWGVTSAFALWGAKALDAVGVDVASWPYWTAPAQAAALRTGVIFDVTSVMNAGIILGALLASILAGRFAPGWRVPLRSMAAAVVGGLLLGYGARAASGCNIGAYFSGIASGSLHGWVWMLAAFAGNAVGTGARPFFGLKVERHPRGLASSS
jgi:uncharacterized membrane protein YedE/YeeE